MLHAMVCGAGKTATKSESMEAQPAESQSEWKLQGSRASHVCINPIRQMRENHYVDVIEQCEKEVLDLAYGTFMYVA